MKLFGLMSDLKIGRKKEPLIKRGITILAWGSLIAAFVFGKFIKQEDYTSILANLYEENPIEILASSGEGLTVKSFENPEHSKIRYGKAQGYGGDLTVGVQYDSAGIIEQIHILEDRETVSFIRKLQSKKYFKQYAGKKINDPLIAGNDIDAVSGCTISSVAFANAIRQASYAAARKEFSLEVNEPTVDWAFGFDEMAVLLLIVIGILSLYLKKKWIRYVALGISLALVGFHLNASISISHFARLLLGFLPDFKEHFVWWILISISIGFPFFLKKNLYCYALCPFHAVETALIKISGFQLKLTHSFQKASKIISLSLLWIAFMLIFLSDNPTLGSYEPFALLFSLDGVGLQWYLLPAALIGALLVPDFYCRYFCPVGRTFNLILKAGKNFRSFFLREKNNKSQDEEIKPLRRTAKRAS